MAKSFMGFNDLPIGRKLLVVGLAVTGLMLAILSGLSIAKSVSDWRTATLTTLTSDARIVAANTAPALLFSDRKAATDTLSALSSAPDVGFAAVYDANGDQFASMGPKAGGPERLKEAPQSTEHTFSQQSLVLLQPITFKGDRVGTLYMKASLRSLYSNILSVTGLIVVTALAAFGLATILLLRMQRGIVRPIVELSGIMRGVSLEGSYAARAPVESADEVGVLAHSFNAMLDVIQDRNAKLAAHQAQLEQAVRERTAELKDANGRLEEELVERKAAQEDLHAHDAMLKAVARSAAELLGSLNLDEAVSSVLELMGETLAVSRVQLSTIGPDRDGHLRSSVQQEWTAPDLPVMVLDPALRALDITTQLPSMVASTLVGERSMLSLDDVTDPSKPTFERAGMKSLLFIPIMAEGKLWGGLWFMDSSAKERQWSWAEADTLATLAGLIGVSTTRARYVQELADANRIVQNSPTVLYRLKGEPTLPFTYVSQNISKFGFEPKDVRSIEEMISKIVHPEDQDKLRAAAAAITAPGSNESVFEYRILLPTGAVRWVENRWTPYRDSVGRLVEVEGIIIDITERKLAEEKIAQLARTDSLTGLANRATFVERLHQAFIATKRTGSPFAVLYLDLDHFKDINDTRGHPTGDKLLREVADRLRTRVRENDMVARLGGDEFAVLQMDIADPSDAGALAGDLMEVLGAPYRIGGEDLRITSSVGISPYSSATPSPDVVLSQADLALYRAKEEGRNQYRFHSDDLDRQVSERVAMADDLRLALERNQLELYFQPQVELLSGKIVGMEALVRWNHPTRGLLSPGAFLSIAERTGAIHTLGRWVLTGACLQMKRWKEQGVAPPVVAVNVSFIELKMGPEFVRQVSEVLQQTGLPAEELELDVTESMLAQVTMAQNHVLDQLGKLGVRIALDDFGTDYSSFEYLRAYKVNHLKVAQTFIEHATQDVAQAATVRAIIGAAKELGIQVIAEGVETQQQRSLLLSIASGGLGQGFYFSEPVEVGRATELLRKGTIEQNGSAPSAA